MRLSKYGRYACRFGVMRESGKVYGSPECREDHGLLSPIKIPFIVRMSYFLSLRTNCGDEKDESMVSLVLRQYMRGENGTENLVGFFFCLAYSNRKT